MNVLYRKTLKAAALGHAETANKLNEQMSDKDMNEYNVFVTAMFCGAVEHRFEDDQSRDAISRFVEEMRYDYRNLAPALKPLTVEGLIRAVFGEEHLLDEIDPLEQFRHQLLAIRKIVDQSDHMQQRIDDYLTDAETLTNEWLNAED